MLLSVGIFQNRIKFCKNKKGVFPSLRWPGLLKDALVSLAAVVGMPLFTFGPALGLPSYC